MSANKAPGQFRATCRKSEWRPFEALLDENGEFRGDLDALPNRWDRKRNATVFGVPCNFETTDRSTFEKHMTDVHGGSLYQWENGSLSPATWGTRVRAYSPRMPIPVRPWPSPKAKPEGAPVVFSSKAVERSVKTCTTCGLVAEVDDRPANVLWWAEHERMCVGSAVVA